VEREVYGKPVYCERGQGRQKMRLMREELYKICSRRIVKLSFALVFAGIFLFFMIIGPWNERCSIGDGRNREDYAGFAAIAKDKELAAEFEGVLTDDVVRRMAESCFFQEYAEDGRVVINRNYVNTFFTDNGLTDGSSRGQKPVSATRTIPLKSSAMGSLTDQPVYFTYVRGWQVLKDSFCVGALLMGVFVIIALSSVFSEEYSLKTISILLTTAHGKRKDIWAKLAAGLVFGTVFFGIGTGFMFLLCGSVYGFQGLGCFAGMLDSRWWLSAKWLASVSYVSIGAFFVRYFLLALSGFLLLAIFMLFASAVSEQNFTALILGLAFFFLPVLLWEFYQMSYMHMSPMVSCIFKLLICCSPIYSCFGNAIEEVTTKSMLLFRCGEFAAIAVPCVWLMFRRYRNYQGQGRM